MSDLPIELAPPEPSAARSRTLRSAPRDGWGDRLAKWFGHLAATALALTFVAGVFAVGQRTGWKVPKFSALTGRAEAPEDDWCGAHSVPESLCVECSKTLMPKGKGAGWCRAHGISECPLCNPGSAQLPPTVSVSPADRALADAMLAFAPRVENNSKCKLHERRIQVASTDVLARLGIEVTAVGRAPVQESISAPGEITYDPTRVARLSARVPGSIRIVTKAVGDRVQAGEVLALIDAGEVGKAKSEFQQAVVQLDLRRRSLANLRASAGAVAEKVVQAAESELEEARVRLLTAEQSLANLGMPITLAEVRGLSPIALNERLRFLALPPALVQSLAGATPSNNLIAIASPIAGEVVARTAMVGELADPTKPLFTVADTGRMWLTLKVRLEDANRLRRGQPVQFQHAGHSGWDAGTVAWISPAADEKTRSVPVRVDLPNSNYKHHANSFGTAQVLLRQVPNAIVVPSSAIHWEGDCNVVFVRDKDFEKAGGFKVFHVRKVRPGAQDATVDPPLTEVVGLLPGEIVATTNSGILRTELLKNFLGAG